MKSTDNILQGINQTKKSVSRKRVVPIRRILLAAVFLATFWANLMSMALSIQQLSASEMIDGSTYVVLAEVLESQRLDPDPDPFFPSVEHTLVIIHSYKGDLKPGETVLVVQNMGGTLTAGLNQPVVSFVNHSKRNPEDLVAYNTIQGVITMDDRGIFTSFGLVGTNSFHGLEGVLKAKGHEVLPGSEVKKIFPKTSRLVGLMSFWRGYWHDSMIVVSLGTGTFFVVLLWLRIKKAKRSKSRTKKKKGEVDA